MKRFLLYGGLAAILGVLYVAAVMLRRHAADREYQRREGGVPAPVPAIVENQGGSVRILDFYAAQGKLSKGAGTNLCYGVQNAREVRLDPPVEQIGPSLSRCIAVAPERTTTYRLTATGKDGRAVSAEFTLQVESR